MAKRPETTGILPVAKKPDAAEIRDAVQQAETMPEPPPFGPSTEGKSIRLVRRFTVTLDGTEIGQGREILVELRSVGVPRTFSPLLCDVRYVGECKVAYWRGEKWRRRKREANRARKAMQRAARRRDAR
jgi:hypothetical protein